MPKQRTDQPANSTVMYDWNRNLVPASDDLVDDYRAVTMEIDYPAAEVTPWAELKDSLKDYWRNRYKHGS